MSTIARTSMSIAAVALAAILQSQPAGAQGTKEAEGAMIGGILGGIVGMIPGGGYGASIAKSFAPVVGSMIGAGIGADLDAQDRAALDRATRRAISSGSGQSFRGKSGARGQVSVTSSSKSEGGQPCRTVKQSVTLKDGRTLSDTVSACKGPNGWQV